MRTKWTKELVALEATRQMWGDATVRAVAEAARTVTHTRMLVYSLHQAMAVHLAITGHIGYVMDPTFGGLPAVKAIVERFKGMTP
jgi:hypothetical protein